MARLKRAVEIQGRTLTDFVVAAADEAACRAIQDAEIIRLSMGATAKSPRGSLTRRLRRLLSSEPPSGIATCSAWHDPCRVPLR
jgi:hypothetical protein